MCDRGWEFRRAGSGFPDREAGFGDYGLRFRILENLTCSVRVIECRHRLRSGHATYRSACKHREPHFAPLSEGVRCRKRQLCVNMSRVNF